MTRFSFLSTLLGGILLVGVSGQAPYPGQGAPNYTPGNLGSDTGRICFLTYSAINLSVGNGPGVLSCSYQLRGDTQISVMGLPIPWNQLAKGWLVTVNYSYEGVWEPYRVARSIVVQLAPLSGTITRTNSQALEIACVVDGHPTRYQMKVTSQTVYENFGTHKLANLPVGTPVTCLAIPGSSPIMAMAVTVQKPEAVATPSTQPASNFPTGNIGWPQIKPGG